MPDEFSPNLGGLESDYRILSELRQSRRSRTYLARHLERNRDVTIVVLGAPRDEQDNSLTLFASDARTLSVIRQPNVVPVIETRWLADGNFAVVRPRVRGAVVDEIVAAEGALTASRVASVLEQVVSAIDWARDNGIVHRGLTGQSVRFQQGSGRAVVELDFSPLGAGGGVPDEYDDARTAGRLAFEMLSGQRPDDSAGASLAELRPDLPERAIRELGAAMSCDRRRPVPDLRMLIAALAAVPDASFVARPPRRDTPNSIRHAAPAELPAPKKSSEPSPTGRWGFGTQLVLLAVISTAVGAAGALLYHRISPRPARVATNSARTTSSAGEVARSKPAPVVRDTHPPTPVQPPPTRRHEPPVTEPSATLPVQPRPTKDSSKVDSLTSPVIDLCDSRDAEDQRVCFANSVERGDRAMDSVYDRLVGALRTQAGLQPAEADPETVFQLRAAQREWLAARKAQCLTVGTTAFYARARSRCYADAARKRANELQTLLDSLGKL